MSGRSRRKKLVRSKRLSSKDSLSATSEANSEQQTTEEEQQHQPLQKAEIANETETVEAEAEQEQQEGDHALPLEAVVVDLPAAEAEADTSEHSDHEQEQNKVDTKSEVEAAQASEAEHKLVAAAASTWRAAADMGDSSNPKWRRVAVRAVQLQDSPKVNGGLKNSTQNTVASDSVGGQNLTLPPPPILTNTTVLPSPPLQTGITPPPGPWGEKLENAAVHVDMGKVVGVLRATTAQRESLEDEEPESEEESTYEDTGADRPRPHDDSLVLEQEEAAKCASCAAAAQNAQNDGEDDVDEEDKDESMCGDPLMYATFVAPVHQYSTETEPSRQASFNYPSRQPSFKQNSSEADGSQPDILQVQQHGHLGVPSNLRTSLTPDRSTSANLAVAGSGPSGAYVGGSQDDIQDIYTEVPPEWPLPPVPPPHLHHLSGSGHGLGSAPVPSAASSEMQKYSDQDCVEISQEELERQVSAQIRLY